MPTNPDILKAIQSAIAACFEANERPLSIRQIKAWIAQKYSSSHFDAKAVHGQIRASCVNKIYTRPDRKDTPKTLLYNEQSRTYTSLTPGEGLSNSEELSAALVPSVVSQVPTVEAQKNALMYERQLQDALLADLSQIEDGLKLWETEPPSIEYPLAVDAVGQSRKRIDILAKDAVGTPVIVELKLNRGHDKVIGQALLYRALLKTKLGAERVRIVLIAYEMSDELRLACSETHDVTLCEYRVSVKVTKV